MRIGKDTIFRTIARAILEALIIAWENGFRQLDLECDNALLVETLLAGGAANSRMVESQNDVADHMAKITSSSSTNLQLFEDPPISVKGLLHVVRAHAINVI
ncbi:hypothetical protein Gohar_015987 [Gossypium harknessii]|uniref:RNase H type-1 domain-containing protein n=1 Tax=Gossypium harknessii TaxID=34285 RepID=A0A7J9G214_9ROSI|nr:hypothetical protein [Gossypium harknessii]